MFNIVMFFTAITLFFAVHLRGPEFGFGVFVGGLLVAALHWLWVQQYRRPDRSQQPSQAEWPRQQRTSPFTPPPSAGQQQRTQQDYRERPIYKKLVQACGGDRSKADRLVAYEMTRDRNLTPASATVEALERLRRDRAGWST